MTELLCRDSLGDRWTHFYRTADQYSRIDYLFASPGLLPEVNRAKCLIYRSADWEEASDHRPIFTAIEPVNPALPAYRDVLVVTWRAAEPPRMDGR